MRDRDEQPAVAGRRSVVPEAAGRSLWLAAVWTGAGAAIVCATTALVVVAVCWLPVSGSGHHANSTIRAGLLTFLASLHGGVTVDGVQTTWLPLGMLGLLALTTWRAGSGLADAAETLGESDPRRLAQAGAAQIAAFTASCLLAVPFASLGTSHASYPGVALSACVVFALTGGLALVRSSPLRGWCAERAPEHLLPMARAALAAVLVYLAAGALLTAVSLGLHHDKVELLSRQVGGGWGGVPVLLLGVLAVPNAVVAATSYLAGPGFALGSGTAVGLTGSAHGVLPAFPVLGAVPAGSGATLPAVLAGVATVLLAGIAAARVAARAETWWRRLGQAAGAAVLAGLGLALLAWQGGGGIGTGRLRTIGASPWQLGGAVAGQVLVVSLVGLGLLAAWRWMRSPIDEVDEVGFLLSPRRLRAVADDDQTEDDTDTDDDTDNADARGQRRKAGGLAG